MSGQRFPCSLTVVCVSTVVTFGAEIPSCVNGGAEIPMCFNSYVRICGGDVWGRDSHKYKCQGRGRDIRPSGLDVARLRLFSSFCLSTVPQSMWCNVPPEINVRRLGGPSLIAARSAWGWWQSAEPVVMPSPSIHVGFSKELSIHSNWLA